MIKVENIKKVYIKNGEKNTILNNISYTFKRGKFYAIIGNSGVGKSTLMQILGILDDDFEGNIFVDDIKINDLTSDEKANIRAEKIGFIFQSFYLNKNLNVLDNVILPLFIKNELSMKEKYNKAKKILNTLKLQDKYENFPNELSGGEQQRVAIARALINDSNIILADEPTGSLDGKTEQDILKILQSLRNDDKCIIVVTHSEEVLKYADVILKLSNGELVENEGK